jgi:hypothetical protein
MSEKFFVITALDIIYVTKERIQNRELRIQNQRKVQAPEFIYGDVF